MSNNIYPNAHVALPILLFALASCGEESVRLQSHSLKSDTSDQGVVSIWIDTEGDRNIRMIDNENNGSIDVIQVIDVKKKRFVTLMGDDCSDVVLVTLGDDGLVHNGSCKVIYRGELYKCEWKKERWNFRDNDGVEYFVRMSEAKGGYAIVTVK